MFNQEINKTIYRLIFISLCLLHQNNNSFANSTIEKSGCYVENYSGFFVVEDELNQQVIDEVDYVFLLDKEYEIDNPLVIDKSTCFFMHGLDRVDSLLTPKYPDKPLIIIKNAKQVNLANIKLLNNGGTNLLVESDDPVKLQLQDMFVEAGQLIIRSPGEYLIQGTYITGLGKVASNIVQDHPHSDLQIVGGNIKHSGYKNNAGSDDFAHVHVKQGRFRIYGTGTQRTLGSTDFIIEAETDINKPHQVVNVRSEGSKTHKYIPSSFVLVPESNKVVDIDIINSSGAWRMSEHGKSRFIKHYASGKVILMGNTSVRGVSVVADAPRANIFAANNIVYGDSMANIKLSNFHLKDNYFSSRKFGGNLFKPYVRKITNTRDGLSFPKVEINVPDVLRKPRLTKPLPGMVNVNDYGVVANSPKDQFELIDNIFKKYKHVYFPEGDYIVSKPVGINSSDNYTYHKIGGWVAGAGSNKTKIINKTSSAVYKTYGMAYATLQGLTLEGSESGDNVPVLSLENKKNIGHATQELMFYDLRIVGGDKGIGIAEGSIEQCSENMFIDLQIRDTNIGVSVGNYNALANMFFDLEIKNVTSGVTHSNKLSGGQWSIYGGEFIDIEGDVFNILNASNGIWFFDSITTTNGSLLRSPNSSAPINLFFNKSKHINAEVNFESAGGVIFNKTETSGMQYYGKSNIAQNYSSFLN